MNKYTGEVILKAGGQDFTLVYDWRALAAIESKFEGKRPEIFKASVSELAEIAAIGLKKHHPDMTGEKLMDLSPAVFSVREAIGEAILYAEWGPEKAQEFLKAQEKASDDDKKKTE